MEQIINRKISLLSFDLDGTLLNSDADISEYTLNIVREAMKKGVKVTLSSGRVPAMLQVFADILGINGPYVAGNGAIVLNNADGSILFEKPLAHRKLMELCELCNSLGLHYSLQTRDVLYYTTGNPRVYMLDKYNSIAHKYGKATSKLVFVERDLSNYTSEATYKIIVQSQTQVLFRKLKAFLDCHKDFEYTFSMAGLFEITAEGTDKGAGIRKVADYYGIPLNEVCAFGDYDNDTRIFEIVGVSVAMDNACSNLKKIAMYHTASNNEDGIAKAISAMWECF